jgi:membrane-associated phospholipid phosphatase
MPSGAPQATLGATAVRRRRSPPAGRGESVTTPEGGLIMRKLTLVAALAAMLAIASASVAAAHPFDREDGRWPTYVLDSVAAIPVSPPPRNRSMRTRAELATLEADQAARDVSPALQAQIAKWDAQPAFAPWTRKTLALISSNATSTTKAQRVMALVHVAMNDAAAAAWYWKLRYHRPSPARLDRALQPAVTSADVPSYPSEHAVLAGAAAAVLKTLYPADATIASDAQEAASSRLYAGANYPTDVAAGLALGEAVAAQVLAAAAGDDLGTGQPGRLPGANCEATPAGCRDFWEPTFPRTPPASPTDPFAGTWHTWVIGSARDFLAPAPPWFRAGPPASVDVPTLKAAALVDYDAAQRTAAQTAEGAARRIVVDTWAGVPDKHWNEIALGLEQAAGLSLPEAIRVSAAVNAAGADAIQANWAAKFTYWEPRPQQVIREYVDPAFVSYRPTPNEPAYSSGLATVSGAIARVLVGAFPSERASIEQAEADAEISRLYDGTHYEHDIAAGTVVGHAIGRVYAARGRCRGQHRSR